MIRLSTTQHSAAVAVTWHPQVFQHLHMDPVHGGKFSHQPSFILNIFPPFFPSELSETINWSSIIIAIEVNTNILLSMLVFLLAE